MEIKRCARCGGFFETANDVCNNCVEKDNKDLGKLKNYFDEYGYSISVTKAEVSCSTGIILKNLNRFLLGKEFSGVNFSGITIENNIENKTKTLNNV